jgi:hypothetical protein
VRQEAELVDPQYVSTNQTSKFIKLMAFRDESGKIETFKELMRFIHISYELHHVESKFENNSLVNSTEKTTLGEYNECTEE